MRWRNFFSRGRIRENCNLYRHGHGSSRRGPRGRPGPARGSAAESSRVRACIAVRRYRSRVQLQAQHRTLICEPSISQQTLTEPGPPPPSAPSLSAPSPSEEDKGRGTGRGQECQSGDAATGLEVKRRNMSPTPPLTRATRTAAHRLPVGSVRSGGLRHPPQCKEQPRAASLWRSRRAARAQAGRARVASGAALLRSVSLARSRYHSIEYFSGGGSLSCLGGERLRTAGRSLGT